MPADNNVHPLKHPFPNILIDFGIDFISNDEHFANAKEPIVFINSGISNFDNDLHS